MDLQTTRTFLRSYCTHYPQAQLQDLFKALHQSACGCEHLVADPSAAADYLRQEAAQCIPWPGPAVEPLPGAYCRVHLDCLRQGLQPQTLARLFALSAVEEPEGPADLAAALSVLRELAAAGEIPFSAQEVEREAEQWRSAGYPARHHSEAFRAAYAPAYRVVRKRYAQFLPLLIRLDQLQTRKPRVLLALEGGSASGKTTLARLLEEVYGAPVFHMDDFFLRPEQRTPERFAEAGGNVDRERFLSQVLLPLSRGEPVAYRRFDCSTFTLLPPRTILPGPLNIVEGTYSLHPDLSAYYDLRVLLETSAQLQRRRIQKRNPPALAQRFFTEWIPLELRYFDALGIPEQCDLIFTADDTAEEHYTLRKDRSAGPEPV